MHFYIIFGTNLLTGGPVPVSIFFLFQRFTEKEYKRNETFARIFLGTNATQETWSTSLEVHEASMRQGARPHPRGPHGAPPTYFFRVYILLYPKTSRRATKPLFHAATFCTREIPFGGLFRHPVVEGFDHGGLLRQLYCPSDEA